MDKVLKYFLIFFCIFLLSMSVNAAEKKPTTSIKKAPPSVKHKKKAINPVRQISLEIRSIALKNNIIHVTIVTNKTILPADYQNVILRVTTPQHKAGKKWPLKIVDTKRSLSLSKKQVIFNTKINMANPGNVKATLLKGTWKTSYRKTLIPIKTMMAKKYANKKTSPKRLPGMRVQGKTPQVKRSNKKPVVPMISKEDNSKAPSYRSNSRAQDRFEESSESVSTIYKKEFTLPIIINHPVGNDEVVWGYTTQISWTMSQEDEPGDCGNRVSIFAIREGTDSRIELAQVNTELGRNTWEWLVAPDTISLGRYHIEIESSEGCGIRGAAFQVKSCDYTIESVGFMNGRSLETGIDARDGEIISGAFRIQVRWNTIELPSTFAPGTEWGNRMIVRSKLTGDVINFPREGANFDYTTALISGGAGFIYVDLPFQFLRDDIAHIMTDSRNIPLEFSFEPTGASVDTNRGNNKFEADMKVSFAKIVDLEIMFLTDDFSLDREWRSALSPPIYHYNFTQRVKVRNAATTIVGTAPADLLNVPVAWYIEYRAAGSTEWGSIPAGAGRFLYSVVEADWAHPMTLSGSFTTPVDDPGRSYRLRMIVDPDNEYLDSDRSSNQFLNTFANPD